jgi:Ca2+-transporting ATPase
MQLSNSHSEGLTTDEVNESRQQYGTNELSYKKENGFRAAVKSVFKEPMVLLLLVAAAIYFISGKTGDGFFLLAAIVLVATISLYQDSRSRNALEKLRNLTKPSATVVRNGKSIQIKSGDVVIGDRLIIEEGSSIVADGLIVLAHDFSVNESILTGESLAVLKDETSEDHAAFAGTTVVSGRAEIIVNAIGNGTRIGKIGNSLAAIPEESTPLEKQLGNFVKMMVIAGAIVFAIVWAINYFKSYSFLDSLLKALTLAMSILPEEIPVAFTTFMALGAWRLMKLGIVVKQMKTVETLGSATVICTDKTGTLTENRMSLAKVFVIGNPDISSPASFTQDKEGDLIRVAMWASEPAPFDPMEIALHEAYAKAVPVDERPLFQLVHEYPLGGKPPMMTHVFKDKAGNRIIAAKGAPEALMNVSHIDMAERQAIEQAIQKLASDGYRVLAVGEAYFEGDTYPEKQEDFKFSFKGILAFYDPPKANMQQVLQDFYKAGIAVKIITGDNALTTAAIARQIGFIGAEKSITGDELMQLTDAELQVQVAEKQIFTRMFPEAKLKIINALKARNEIVAMTGDGVNDGPALKAAHIGIAMGKKGTEIAKEAASLILLEDDLSAMVTAIAMGRKIYANLKKAIRYIISIHIPIILTVFIPLALGWIYPNIFSPVHIIFLELIMGPTCSIIYEHEPMEANAMNQKPRHFTTSFFKRDELLISVLQGLVITAGTLAVYQYAIHQTYNESLTRTMVFATLITANITLTLVNRSFYYSIFTTIRYKNNLVLLINLITISITSILLFVAPLTRFFKFEQLDLSQIAICILIGLVSVLWIELAKWIYRLKSRHQSIEMNI